MAFAHWTVLWLPVPRLRPLLFLAAHSQPADGDFPPEVFQVLSEVLSSWVLAWWLWEAVLVVCFQVICPDVSFASMSGLSIDLNHNADIFLAKVSLLPYIPLLFLSFLFSSSGRSVSPATLLLRIFDSGDTIGAPSFCRAVLSGKGF